jgi:hypothetical protein
LTEQSNDVPTYKNENWKKRCHDDDDDDDDYTVTETTQTTWSFGDILRRAVQMAEKLTVPA